MRDGQQRVRRLEEVAPSVEPGGAAVRRGAPAGARRFLLIAAAAVAAAVATVAGVRTLLFYAHHVTTDDAQIEGHIDPVLSRVGGYVAQVLVDDNQRVAADQVLVRIDPRDLQARVDMADAALASARAAVAVAVAKAQVAQARRAQTAQDLARDETLRRQQVVPPQRYDASKAAADAAAAEYAAATRGVAAAEAEVGQRQKELDYAALQLSYATIKAPVAGIVSKKNVEVGEYVEAGQPLLAVVQERGTWVVANFKETQLRGMQVGQPVTVTVDAYPQHPFRGRVESIASATGAKFALLPPDNATGNFVKVVQRVPVKVVLTDPPDPAHPLRVGMSLTATVALQ